MVPRCLYMSSMPPACYAWELVESICDLIMPLSDTVTALLSFCVVKPDCYRSRVLTCDCQPIHSSPNVDNQCLVCRFAEVTTSFASLRDFRYRLAIVHSCQAPLRPITFPQVRDRLLEGLISIYLDTGEFLGDLTTCVGLTQ